MFDCLEMMSENSEYTILCTDPKVYFLCWNPPWWWSYEHFVFLLAVSTQLDCPLSVYVALRKGLGKLCWLLSCTESHWHIV